MIISRIDYKVTKGKQCEWLEHAWRQTQLDLHCLWPGFHTEDYPFWAFPAFRLSLFAILILAFVFAPLHYDRHIFPRTVAAVLMLRRSETLLSVSLGLKLSIQLIRGFPQPKSFEYEPQTSNTWNTKRQRDWFLFYADISALFIRTRLAGIEEDEDLLTACVSDVRSVNMSLDFNFVPLY